MAAAQGGESWHTAYWLVYIQAATALELSKVDNN
jgi:hypothetical protein